MSLSAYEIALIGGGFTLLGVLVGGLISYYFSTILINRQEFNKAAAEFRASFVDEFFRIRRNAGTLHERWGERSEEIAIANEKAKIIFEAFLPAAKLNGFNTAWGKYKEADTGGNSPLTEEGREKIAEIRLLHINNLLEFAKPKL